MDRTNAFSVEQDDTSDFVTLMVGGQLFGIPVLQVQDVLNPMPVTRIPLAPPEVYGVLNLRGRIVTAINMRIRLGLPPREDGSDTSSKKSGMSIVVEHKGELYSLSVDSVGDVISCGYDAFEKTLPTLDPHWRDVAAGVYRLQSRLLIILDISQLLNFTETVV